MMQTSIPPPVHRLVWSAAGRKAATRFIFITVALEVIAAGTVMPVLPKLLRTVLHIGTYEVARTIGLFGTVWALMQLVFSPILGALSDRFGRRPLIVLSNFGLGLDSILMALAPSIGWLVLGRCISGITSAIFGTAGAYIADVTPIEKRAEAFGVIVVAFCVGIIIGPAIGGLLGSVDIRLPFWVAAALGLVNGIYGFYVLPESLPKHLRRPFSWKNISPLQPFIKLKSHKDLPKLAWAYFLGVLAHQVFANIFVLYSELRYRLTEQTVGFVLCLTGISSGLVAFAALRPVITFLGEKKSACVGLGFGMLGFHLIASSTHTWGMVLGSQIISLWGFTNPSVQSMISQRVSERDQGEIQGLQSSLAGLAFLIAPGFYTQIFSHSLSRKTYFEMPGAPFFVAEIFLLIALLIIWKVPLEHRK